MSEPARELLHDLEWSMARALAQPRPDEMLKTVRELMMALEARGLVAQASIDRLLDKVGRTYPPGSALSSLHEETCALIRQARMARRG